MITDRSLLEEYPFDGYFYESGVDETLPIEEQTDEERLVMYTECDIQESGKSQSFGNIKVSFNIYFPFDKNEGINIKRGMIFRGNMYGMEVNGVVVGVCPTQMGGCACYISDLDV